VVTVRNIPQVEKVWAGVRYVLDRLGLLDADSRDPDA
jgi:hypothetical protein